ncbi:hypothetical protein GW17_00053615 [Ensete ventricosum]|nr:hypothetical protein GW17_00053615 [Ensete ventricosum]
MRPERSPAHGWASAAAGMRGRRLRGHCCTRLPPCATVGGIRGYRLMQLPLRSTDPASAWAVGSVIDATDLYAHSLTHYKDLGSCSDLLCDEDASELADDSPDRSRDAEFPVDSDESIAGFIEGEADYTPGFDYPARFRSNSLDSTSRRDAVAWILKVSAYYRFQDLTAYLAVNYMDRFLASHRLPVR